MRFLTRVLLGLALCTFATSAHATWLLNNDASHLSFGSEKKGNVGEVHHFTELSGSVDENGKVILAIDLSSIETWADIRNERMLEHLFEATTFPQARIEGSIDLSKLADLAPGQREIVDLGAQFTLHGVSQSMDAELSVFRLTDSRILVVAHELVMLDATAFGLAGGIEKLRELADLPSISAAVPVAFYLVFEKK